MLSLITKDPGCGSAHEAGRLLTQVVPARSCHLEKLTEGFPASSLSSGKPQTSACGGGVDANELHLNPRNHDWTAPLVLRPGLHPLSLRPPASGRWLCWGLFNATELLQLVHMDIVNVISLMILTSAAACAGDLLERVSRIRVPLVSPFVPADAGSAKVLRPQPRSVSASH